MTYRLAIIAAGAVGSADEAGDLVAAMRARPRGGPPMAMRELLGALSGSDAVDYSVGRTDARGALLNSHLPEQGVLETLLLLAKGREVAVYDIKLNRLYDPDGHVEVDVLVPGVRLPFLTRTLLHDLVLRPGWPDPEAPYLIVERAEEDFVQAWLGMDGTYQVEYREGGPESHFVSYLDDVGAVVDLIWSWVTDDPLWRTAVQWVFLDVDAADAELSASR